MWRAMTFEGMLSTPLPGRLSPVHSSYKRLDAAARRIAATGEGIRQSDPKEIKVPLKAPRDIDETPRKSNVSE
jgi:hypothetical protein